MSKARLGVFLLVAALSCESPTGVSLDGHWVGTTFYHTRTWTFDIAVEQHADSLTGMAHVTAGEFNEQYFVRGRVIGDSVTINLRPVEDADFNFAGHFSFPGRIAARVWFNAFVADASDITLARR